jgi:regulator of RNase E activity RraA
VGPDDYVVADLDGVVVIPNSLLSQVQAICEKRKKEDELCMRDIKDGRGLSESFKLHRMSNK